MTDLPDIHIAISDNLRAFLEQMAEAAVATGRFDVERRLDPRGELLPLAVNFRSLEPSPHRGLGIQLIASPAWPRLVALEARAERWQPNPPTAPVYVEAARSLAGPLLRAFNRRHATRYRLRVEHAGRRRFVPSARTAMLLDRFAVLANAASLHPLDWKRFYELVREGRQEIPSAELRALLVGKGFSRETADHLAEIYVHLSAYKRLR